MARFGRLMEMRDTLPHNLKTKVNAEDIKRLAVSLEDGSVLDIIKELEEIQQLTENSLLKSRIKVVNDHKKQLGELSRRHQKELSGTPLKDDIIPIKARHEREKQEMEEHLQQELRMTDQKIILDLDQLIVSQQNTLQSAEVPLFYVSNDPTDIELQSRLLQFILRIQ